MNNQRINSNVDNSQDSRTLDDILREYGFDENEEEPDFPFDEDKEVVEDEEDDSADEDKDVEDSEVDKDKEEEVTEEDKEEETETDTEEETPKKKKQTKEEDTYYKNLRLQTKKSQEEAVRLAELQGKREGLVQAVNGINPYTNEKIVDDADIDEYLLMKDIKDKGGDPIVDYHKHVKENKRIQEKALKEKQELEEFIQKDIVDFDRTYPKVNRDDLMKNKQFILFSKGKLGVIPLKTIYEDYNELLSLNEIEVESIAEDIVIKKNARKQSSPGKVGTSRDNEIGDNQYFTLEEIKGFTLAEVEKNLDKINKSINYHASNLVKTRK